MRREVRAALVPFAIRAAVGFSVLGAALYFATRARVPAGLPPDPPRLTSAPPLPAATWPDRFSVGSKELPPKEALAPGTRRILVFGDSVASFLGVAMRYRQEEVGAFVAERGVGQCTIFESKARLVNGKVVEGTSCSATWVEDVARLRPEVTLLVQGGAFFGDQTCDRAWLESYQERILFLVRAMGKDAGRVVLASVPYPMDRWRYGNLLDRVDCFNGMLRRTAAKGNLPMLDLMGHLCPTRACNDESQGLPIRPDGLHFDGVGAEETARWALRELLSPAAPEGAPQAP